MKLFVGNLEPTMKGDDLGELFKPYGDVTAARVCWSVNRATDHETSKGYGYVEMADEDARNAMKALHGTVRGIRSLTVVESDPNGDGTNGRLRDERPYR